MVEDSEANGKGEAVIFPERGFLVPIEDEDPIDAVREVEWAMEREELRRCHLTMDDQVF